MKALSSSMVNLFNLYQCLLTGGDTGPQETFGNRRRYVFWVFTLILNKIGEGWDGHTNLQCPGEVQRIERIELPKIPIKFLLGITAFLVLLLNCSHYIIKCQ